MKIYIKTVITGAQIPAYGPLFKNHFANQINAVTIEDRTIKQTGEHIFSSRANSLFDPRRRAVNHIDYTIRFTIKPEVNQNTFLTELTEYLANTLGLGATGFSLDNTTKNSQDESRIRQP